MSARRQFDTGHTDLRSCVILNMYIGSSESSEAREVHLQAIRSHHQSTR